MNIAKNRIIIPKFQVQPGKVENYIVELYDLISLTSVDTAMFRLSAQLNFLINLLNNSD